MKNKLLLSVLVALGFVGCDKSGDIPDIPLYYGPGPNWNNKDIKIPIQVNNEEGKPINGIRSVLSYANKKDSLISDTTYTQTTIGDRDIKTDGVAINKANFNKFPPKDPSKVTIEYTDVDREENGSYQSKTVYLSELKESKVTLFKKKAE